MSQRVGGDILALQAPPKSLLASHAMEGIWAIPAIRNTLTFFRLGTQTGTAWSVLLAEVPLCVLTDPKADIPLPAQKLP